MTEPTMPYICPDHPDGHVRHEWLRTRATARLTGASWEYDEPGSHRFSCAKCGRELAPEAPQAPEETKG